MVLLILASVTITLMFGDNNIFDLAKEAAEKANQAIKDDTDGIGKIDSDINKWANGSSSSGGLEENPSTPSIPKVEDSVDRVLSEENNTILEDKNKNKIVVPAGFKIVPNSPEGTNETEKVVYTYNKDGTPAVQDGIVVEDNSNGNQFIWVPVGTVNNKNDTTHGTTSTITLGRYDNFTKVDGEYKPKQTAETQYKKLEDSTDTDLKYQENYQIRSNYMELNEKLTKKNEVAKNLEDFITKAIVNGGYYIARYEASGKTEGVVKSKANQTVWNSINQQDASSYSQDMYDDSNMESDLINSYAWDTAIIFIQTYSSENSNYANQTTKKSGTSPFNTGTSGDRACNIHDMASNCREWSTEYSNGTIGSTSYNSTLRGGNYNSTSRTTSYRSNDNVNSSNSDFSFRPILYCNTKKQ